MLSSKLGMFINLCPPMYTEPRSGLPLWVGLASGEVCSWDLGLRPRMMAVVLNVGKLGCTA